jgi:hypothetical protein
MRWALFTGIGLFALVVIAASVGRVIRVVNLFAPASASESESIVAATPHTDDPVTRSPARPAEVVHPASVEVSAGIDEALRVAPANGAQSKRGESESRRALPQAALDQDLRPVMAGMKLGPADPGAQVQDLARKVAPTLASEALDHSAGNVARNAEVEHELLETWKEQKQILAGKRDTVDSVLKDPPQ